jgi:photosystem II stability/assembly factor-like uncharacterized protein
MLCRLVVSSAVALLSLAPSAAAGVLVGHSGWQWSNPLPQGNSLRALDFQGDSGYAAGDFGTLLRSGDDGISWRAGTTGTTDDLSVVRSIGPDSVVVAGGCTLLRSDDGGESFRSLRWTAHRSSCKTAIASISFPTPDVGYLLLEDGRVYRSDDGGESWSAAEPVALPQPDEGDGGAADLFFSAPDVGIAATFAGIHRTTDGAQSWELVGEHPGGFAGLSFVDAQTGYAAGAGGLVAKTLDGGATWIPTASTLFAGSVALRAIDCADSLTCLAATESGDRLLRTSNGGLSWSVSPAEVASALAVSFASPAHAVAVGSAGAVSVSSDAGLGWSLVGTRLDASFARLCDGPGSLAFAVGPNGILARTNDGGESWTILAAPSRQDVVDVSFRDEASGFALDGAGALYRTDDGGEGWELVYDGAASSPQAVLALDSDHVLLVGSRGVARSVDGGRTFSSARQRAVRKAGLFGIDHAGGWLFVYGPTSIFASRDRGTSWRKVRRPDHRPLAALDFVSAHSGFALGKGGRAWRTRDQGRSWHEMLGAGTDGGMALSFSNARDGYLAANDIFFAKGSQRPDYVLRTTDGGARWRPQLVANTRNLNGLLATRSGTDFLLAGEDQLFATRTGGDEGESSSLRLRARHRRVARGRKVRISGRLRPAETGQVVVVSRTELDPHARKGANDWSFKAVHVRAGGGFATHWRLHRSSVFVAQWTGDGVQRGAGSKALVVRVNRR